MKAIILAADFGTGLYPVTKFCPKALLELGDKTLLDSLVSKLEKIPIIREIVIVTNGHFWEYFFNWKRKASYQKKITLARNPAYAPERKEGDIKDLALGIESSETQDQAGFLVLSVNHYFEHPLSHFILACLGHREHILMGVADVKDLGKASRYSTLHLDERSQVIQFEEKSEHHTSTLVSAGVYYFPSTLKTYLRQYLDVEHLNPDRMEDFTGWLLRREKVFGLELAGAWFEIGDLHSYNEAENYFEEKKLKEAKSHDAKHASE